MNGQFWRWWIIPWVPGEKSFIYQYKEVTIESFQLFPMILIWFTNFSVVLF